MKHSALTRCSSDNLRPALTRCSSDNLRPALTRCSSDNLRPALTRCSSDNLRPALTKCSSDNLRPALTRCSSDNLRPALTKCSSDNLRPSCSHYYVHRVYLLTKYEDWTWQRPDIQAFFSFFQVHSLLRNCHCQFQMGDNTTWYLSQQGLGLPHVQCWLSCYSAYTTITFLTCSAVDLFMQVTSVASADLNVCQNLKIHLSRSCLLIKVLSKWVPEAKHNQESMWSVPSPQ